MVQEKSILVEKKERKKSEKWDNFFKVKNWSKEKSEENEMKIVASVRKKKGAID